MSQEIIMWCDQAKWVWLEEQENLGSNCNVYFKLYFFENPVKVGTSFSAAQNNEMQRGVYAMHSALC